MARKTRCRQCGAKNPAEAERCRICGTVMAEPAHGDEIPEPTVVDQRTLPPLDDETFDPTEIGQPWTATAPPSPTREDPVVEEDEVFDLRGLTVDTNLYRKPKGPPIVNADEHFDPIDIEVEEHPVDPDAPPLGEDEVDRFVPIEQEPRPT